MKVLLIRLIRRGWRTHANIRCLDCQIRIWTIFNVMLIFIILLLSCCLILIYSCLTVTYSYLIFACSYLILTYSYLILLYFYLIFLYSYLILLYFYLILLFCFRYFHLSLESWVWICLSRIIKTSRCSSTSRSFSYIIRWFK